MVLSKYSFLLSAWLLHADMSMLLTSLLSSHKTSRFSVLRFTKSATRSTTRVIAGVMSLLAVTLLSQPSWAQTQTELPSPSSTIFNAPSPPPDQGAPTGRRDGGASRGNCPEYGDLAALVPITEGRVWGQTTAAQPTLWFYLPSAVTPETPLELIVQDAEDNTLYRARLAVELDAGTMAIALPETVTLPVGEPHYWTMALFCDPQRPSSSVFVSGAIERVSVAGLEPITKETARSLSQAQAYASAGVWYDALTVLAKLRQTDETHPNERDLDSQTAWATLLEQAGLAQISTEPVQPCCEVE